MPQAIDKAASAALRIFKRMMFPIKNKIVQRLAWRACHVENLCRPWSRAEAAFMRPARGGFALTSCEQRLLYQENQ